MFTDYAPGNFQQTNLTRTIHDGNRIISWFDFNIVAFICFIILLLVFRASVNNKIVFLAYSHSRSVYIPCRNKRIYQIYVSLLISEGPFKGSNLPLPLLSCWILPRATFYILMNMIKHSNLIYRWTFCDGVWRLRYFWLFYR